MNIFIEIEGGVSRTTSESLCKDKKRQEQKWFFGAMLRIDKKRRSKLITELAEHHEKEQRGDFSDEGVGGSSQLEYSV